MAVGNQWFLLSPPWVINIPEMFWVLPEQNVKDIQLSLTSQNDEMSNLILVFISESWKLFTVLAKLHFKAQINSVCKQEEKWKHTFYITTDVFLLKWVSDGKSKRGHTYTENSLYLEWQNSTTSHHRMEQSASQITWFLFQVHPVKPNPHKGLVWQELPLCRLPVSWTT